MSILECRIPSAELANIESGERAVEALRRYLAPKRIVRVEKWRWLYSDARSRIEVAEFAIGSERFGTVCVESEDASECRNALNQLAVVEFGRPRNYMELLHEAMPLDDRARLR
jgi:hypothetical protein